MNSTDNLQALIDEVTRPAYENVESWMRSDPDVAAQLRDGLRTLLDRFDAVEANDQPAGVLLDRLLTATREVLAHYQSLPGSQGEWECSALRKVESEIIKLLRRP